MQEAGTGFIGDAQTSNWTYSHESRHVRTKFYQFVTSSRREPNGALGQGRLRAM